MREKKYAYTVLLDVLEGKKTLGIPRCRWVDDVKMVRRKIECRTVDWLHTYSSSELQNIGFFNMPTHTSFQM
jgi:hypothetical protein